MLWRRLSVATDSFWRTLGLSRDAEDLYRALITAPGRDALAIAVELGLPPDRAAGCVAELTELRLLRTAAGLTEPVDPRVALTALARSRQALLDRAGSVADELGAVLAAGRLEADPFRYFELLRGPVEIVARIQDLLHGAEQQVVGTVAPPYVAGGDDSVFTAELDLLTRGVRFRSLYDTTVLDVTTYLDRMRALEAAGEEARVRPDLSVKLLLVDGVHAVVPLVRTADRPEPTAIVLGASALTDALGLLFELLWERSRPVALTVPDETPAGGLDADHRRILQLLGNGMTDSAIATALGISERTLRRRLATLQRHYGAGNRFQLGAAWSTGRAVPRRRV